MIRTIRPLDRPDPALERVAKANGFSLHAGVSCEGHQKDKRGEVVSVHRPSCRCRSSPLAQFYRQGSLYPEDALPGRDDPGGIRSSGFHCAIGGPRAQTQGQPHPLPWRSCP